jgi:hypothetical protein
MVLFVLSTHLHTSIANNISLIGYAIATVIGHGDVGNRDYTAHLFTSSDTR